MRVPLVNVSGELVTLEPDVPPSPFDPFSPFVPLAPLAPAGPGGPSGPSAPEQAATIPTMPTQQMILLIVPGSTKSGASVHHLARVMLTETLIASQRSSSRLRGK